MTAIRQHQVGIERMFRAQAVALGASAVRAVEAERSRLQFFVAQLAIRTGVLGAEDPVEPRAPAGWSGSK